MFSTDISYHTCLTQVSKKKSENNIENSNTPIINADIDKENNDIDETTQYNDNKNESFKNNIQEKIVLLKNHKPSYLFEQYSKHNHISSFSFDNFNTKIKNTNNNPIKHYFLKNDYNSNRKFF